MADRIGEDTVDIKEIKELREDLYQKMCDEQAEYKDELLAMQPTDILFQADVYTAREEIISAVYSMNMDPERIKALLKLKHPLAEIYRDFSKCDVSNEDVIHIVMEERADKTIQELKDAELDAR